MGVEISAGILDSREMSLHTNTNNIELVLGVLWESGMGKPLPSRLVTEFVGKDEPQRIATT